MEDRCAPFANSDLLACRLGLVGEFDGSDFAAVIGPNPQNSVGTGVRIRIALFVITFRVKRVRAAYQLWFAGVRRLVHQAMRTDEHGFRLENFVLGYTMRDGRFLLFRNSAAEQVSVPVICHPFCSRQVTFIRSASTRRFAMRIDMQYDLSHFFLIRAIGFRGSWTGRPATVSCSRRPYPGLGKLIRKRGVDSIMPYNSIAPARTALRGLMECEDVGV